MRSNFALRPHIMCRSMADIQTTTAEIRRGKKELERGPMPNVRDGRYGAQPIGGAVCNSSVIQFLVPRRKIWLMPAAGVPCSIAANI